MSALLQKGITMDSMTGEQRRIGGASLSMLVLTLGIIALLLAFRAGSGASAGWDNVRLGDTEQQIISTLGEPDQRVEMDFGNLLRYPDMTLEFQDNSLFSIQVTGPRDALFQRAVRFFGSPLDDETGRTDWVTDHVVARLYGDEIMISRID